MFRPAQRRAGFVPQLQCHRRVRAVSRASFDPGMLHPLEGKPKEIKFCTWDIESKDGDTQKGGFTRPFLVGLNDGKNFNAFFDQTEGGDWKSRFYLPGGCVDRFMNAALCKAYKGYWFYAHNAGNFDFLFLLPWLARNIEKRDLVISLIPVGNSGLLAIDVWHSKNKWQKWRFVDSVKLLPMTLNKAAKSFGIGEKFSTLSGEKITDRHGNKMDYDTPEDDPGWIAYNRSDCELLYGVLESAFDMIENVFGGEVGLTAPSTAMKTFRRQFLLKAIERNEVTHEFIRESYCGGRTEVFYERGRYLSDYDINSSYPASMTDLMPVGDAKHWGATEPPKRWLKDRIGFCRVCVYVPPMQIPPLPIKACDAWFPRGSGVEGKLLFPTGYIRGVWEWGELQNAIAYGAKIVSWEESWWYKAEPLLAAFMETLYKYRNQAKCFDCRGKLGKGPNGMAYWCKKCEQPGYSAGLDAWAKLMANSTYGRFAMNPEKTKLYWRTDPERPDGCLPLIDGDPESQLWYKVDVTEDVSIMPQISARITALSRVKLYQFAMAAEGAVNRRCTKCHSKVSFKGKSTGNGWLLDTELGGFGPHGDATATDKIDRASPCCPCGGAIHTAQGRVCYMDTDSLMTDSYMETGAELGELKDEIPRYSGYLEGRFYAPKLYRLSVDPDYTALPVDLRIAMLKRDVKHCDALTKPLAEAIDDCSWDLVKAKGVSRKLRTKETLDTLYEGAVTRMAWLADAKNKNRDGSHKPMPEEIEAAGTVFDTRLEKFGTLSGLVKRDRNGDAIRKTDANGFSHPISDSFGRGPQIVTVPKRLHLDGSKRIHQRDGSTVAFHIDMRGKEPQWWKDREERKIERAEKRAWSKAQASA